MVLGYYSAIERLSRTTYFNEKEHFSLVIDKILGYFLILEAVQDVFSWAE